MNLADKKNLPVLSFLYKRRAELFFFLLFAAEFFLHKPDKLHEWTAAWYAMDYSLGFDSRLLVGSLLRCLSPGFLPESTAYAFVVCSILVMLFLFACVLGQSLRRMESHPARAGLFGLILFYLAGPGSPAYLWSTENMGRFDLYLLLLTLAAVLIHFHLRSHAGRFLCFALIGVSAMAVHQVYLFIYFPLLFLLLADTAFCVRRKPASLAGAGGALAVIGASFVYFQFFSGLRVTELSELLPVLTSRTNLPVNEVALNFEYFSPFRYSLTELVRNNLGERIRYGIVTLALLSPLAAIYGYLWFHILRNSKKESPGTGSSALHLLILLSLASFVPAYILTIDWGRWFGAFLTVQFLQLVILAAGRDPAVTGALSRLSALIRRHPVLSGCVLLYLASFDKFQATLLPQAPAAFTALYQLTHLF